MTIQLDDLVTKLILDNSGFNTGVAGAKTTATGLQTGLTSTFKAIGLSGVLQFATISGAIGGTMAALKELYTSTLEYGDVVRDLTLANGLTAEQASILIQVTDDYKISTDDLKTASRKLTQEGLSMTVDTLAELSDKYLALNTPAERQLFLITNLGRNGAVFNEMMLLGGDAIRQLGDAVSTNNILSADQLLLQRENEAALDSATDAYDGLKNVIGNLLMGPGAQFLNWLATSLEGWGRFFEFWTLLSSGTTGGIRSLVFPNFPAVPNPNAPGAPVPVPKGERDTIGSTTNITINNPTGETSEASVNRALATQSYLGNRR